MTESQGLTVSQPVIAPPEIVAGLGNAPRDLLATCIALFEDTKLVRRVGVLYERLKEKVSNATSDSARREAETETVASVQTRASMWNTSKLNDDHLRLVLWIYLRNA